jgi:hypothetical protein
VIRGIKKELLSATFGTTVLDNPAWFSPYEITGVAPKAANILAD